MASIYEDTDILVVPFVYKYMAFGHVKVTIKTPIVLLGGIGVLGYFRSIQ